MSISKAIEALEQGERCITFDGIQACMHQALSALREIAKPATEEEIYRLLPFGDEYTDVEIAAQVSVWRACERRLGIEDIAKELKHG